MAKKFYITTPIYYVNDPAPKQGVGTGQAFRIMS